MHIRIIILLFFTLVLSSCSQHVHFSSTPGEGELIIKGQSYGRMPFSTDIRATTFGNYEFIAKKEGFNNLRGRLPLQVSKKQIFADVVLFAPALFFNSQYPFREYKFNFEKRTISFRDDGDWAQQPVSP